ncbi:hypothetical protein HRbin17_02579 [bacterium HR17]|uniref:Uncharacterized protein n=1 Tax=Candidatus Fervidibacter japonicus TaxID=2035412 RepID=A0A2H5XFT6_9BACT|nr:hypothetical protein HRbin17_02579 [bacterium HR17]
MHRTHRLRVGLVGVLGVMLVATHGVQGQSDQWSVSTGVFLPFTERLGGDWSVSVDWRSGQRWYLGGRWLRSKEDRSPIRGTGMALMVGMVVPGEHKVFKREGVRYWLGWGAGVGRLEATGRGHTWRGMVEGFIEAEVGGWGVRIGSCWGGLDGTNGWFLLFVRYF